MRRPVNSRVRWWGVLVGGLMALSGMDAESARATSTGVPLILGAEVSGTIGGADQEDSYTFSGTAGMRLFYDSLSVYPEVFETHVSLLDPSGMLVGLDGRVETDAGPFTLTEPGQYTLLIRGGLAWGNDYAFRLIDVSESPAEPLTLGSVSRGILDPPGRAAIYRFIGTAGQRLFLEREDSSSATYRLFGPANDLQVDNPYRGTSLTLPGDGTYLLVVATSSTNGVPYQFQLVAPSTQTFPRVLGSRTHGTIRTIGEEHRFTFQGEVGQCLFYQASSAVADAPLMRLLAPDGQKTIWAGNSSSSYSPWTVQEPETFYLVLGGQTDAVGDYEFWLMDLTQAPTLPFGSPVQGTLDPPNSAAAFQFVGITGQRFMVTSGSAGSAPAAWFLVAPNDHEIAGAGIGLPSLPFRLPTSGAYYFVVSGLSRASTPLPYELLCTNLPDIGVAKNGFGVTHSGTLQAGERAEFELSGPAALPVFFDNLAPQPNLAAQLLGPNGSPMLVSFGATVDMGPYALPEPGTYRMTLEPAPGAPSAAYSFRVLDLDTVARGLELDSRIETKLESPYESVVYRIDGIAGQRLYCDALQGASGRAAMRLWFDANGYPISAACCDSYEDAGAVFVARSGPIYVVQASYQATPIESPFRVLDLRHAQALELNALTTVELPAYQTTTFRLDPGPAHLFFDNLSSGIEQTSWEVLGPDNYSLARHRLAEDFEITITRPGEHILLFHNDSTNGLICSFRVIRSTLTTELVDVGAVITADLKLPGDEIRWKFAGAPGQRIYYHSLDATGAGIDVRMIAPGGTTLMQGDSAVDAGPFALIESGTFILAMHNRSDHLAQGHFRLLDVREIPILGANLFNGQITLSWPSVLGQRYQLQFTEDLARPRWTDLGPVVQALGPRASSTDSASPSYAQRFYRVALIK